MVLMSVEALIKSKIHADRWPTTYYLTTALLAASGSR